MSPERLAFVLIDGIGDVTIPALGSRTPLQAATVPYLNAVAGEVRLINNDLPAADDPGPSPDLVLAILGGAG